MPNVMSKAKADELGIKGLAYMRSFVTVGVDPAIMGIGPIPAIQKLLAKNNLKVSDIDIFDGDTPANETIASFSPSRDATSVGSLWELSDPLGLAELPGNVLLAGLIAAYTKNGIFASLFILRSVSAAPKPWYYALYVPGSGWGVFSTWDLCAAHGAIAHRWFAAFPTVWL